MSKSEKMVFCNLNSNDADHMKINNAVVLNVFDDQTFKKVIEREFKFQFLKTQQRNYFKVGLLKTPQNIPFLPWKELFLSQPAENYTFRLGEIKKNRIGHVMEGKLYGDIWEIYNESFEEEKFYEIANSVCDFCEMTLGEEGKFSFKATQNFKSKIECIFDDFNESSDRMLDHCQDLYKTWWYLEKIEKRKEKPMNEKEKLLKNVNRWARLGKKIGMYEGIICPGCGDTKYYCDTEFAGDPEARTSVGLICDNCEHKFTAEKYEYFVTYSTDDEEEKDESNL